MPCTWFQSHGTYTQRPAVGYAVLRTQSVQMSIFEMHIKRSAWPTQSTSYRPCMTDSSDTDLHLGRGGGNLCCLGRWLQMAKSSNNSSRAA